MLLRCRAREITFPRRPLVMGIVNLNDDSFSGDGTLDPEAALAQARALIEEGADIIDVGAESARTNRPPIPVAEETRRLRPFLEGFPDLVAAFPDGPPFDNEQVWPPLLSVNTWRPEVVEAVLFPEGTGPPAAVDLVNDMGGLPDPANAALCARHGAALLIMHSVGQPKEPHLDQAYDDVLGELTVFFREKIALAEGAGLAADRILLDPGLDFAKQREDNLRILRSLERFQALDRPLLLPVSRKTVIGEVLGLEEPSDRDAGTIACLVAGTRRGAAVFRVHNVATAAQALKVVWAVEGTGLPY